jgi:hypothetical protein
MAKRRASHPPRDVRLDYFRPCAVHKGGFIFMLAPNFRGIAIILGVPERLTKHAYDARPDGLQRPWRSILLTPA